MIYTHKDCLLLHKKRLKNVFSYVTYLISVRWMFFPNASYCKVLVWHGVKTSEMISNNSCSLPNTTKLNGIFNLSSLSSWYETWHSYSPESFNCGSVSFKIQTFDPSLCMGENLLSCVYNISPIVNIFKSLRLIHVT